MKRTLLLTLAATMLVALSARADDKDKDKGKSTTQAARKELLDKYDTNKDGKIDKEERAKMSAEDKKAWAHAGDHKKGKKGDKEKAKAQ